MLTKKYITELKNRGNSDIATLINTQPVDRNATKLLTIKEASLWATSYTGKNVMPSNITYLIQCGRVKKNGDNGATLVSMDDYLNDIDKLIPYPQTINTRCFMSIFSPLIICDYRIQWPIIEMLSCKKDNLVQLNNKRFRVKDIAIHNERMNAVISKNKPYKITDSKDNVLNNSTNFKNVTYCLMQPSVSYNSITINHNTAIKRYEEIKANIEAEKNDDLVNF